MATRWGAASSGTVTVTTYAQADFPDSVIVVTPNTPIDNIKVTAQTIPYDLWGLTLPTPLGIDYRYSSSNDPLLATDIAKHYSFVGEYLGNTANDPFISDQSKGSGRHQVRPPDIFDLRKGSNGDINLLY